MENHLQLHHNHTTCHVYTNFSQFSPRASRRSHHPCLMIPAAWWKRTSTKPKFSMLFSSDRLPSRHSMENLHKSMQRLLQRTANCLCPSQFLSRMWSVPYVRWMLEKHQALTAFQHVSLLFLKTRLYTVYITSSPWAWLQELYQLTGSLPPWPQSTKNVETDKWLPTTGQSHFWVYSHSALKNSCSRHSTPTWTSSCQSISLDFASETPPPTSSLD